MNRTLLDSLLDFGFRLREAGIRVTTRQIADLARALELTGLDDRATVFRTARALLVTRRDQFEAFRREFDAFWRDSSAPEADAGAPRTMPPAPRHRREKKFTVATYMAFRASEDLEELDVADRSGTFTADEVLHRKKFAEMTPEELEQVKKLIREMRWRASLRRTRRRESHRSGAEIDFRRVLKRTARLGGAVPARLPRRRRKEQHRPIVLLADVSGSMEKYSRLVLQFFHSLSHGLPDVEAFVFGTRLTRITPALEHRDLDRALDEAAATVVDWAGGTRIGASLAVFNRTWSRRVLRRGAIVVIVSDGCDREDSDELRNQMRYLRHRCHRLVWLNPYAGSVGYEPRVAGMEAALPFVDDFLPLHDLQSLHEFSRALASMPATGRSARSHGRHA